MQFKHFQTKDTKITSIHFTH